MAVYDPRGAGNVHIDQVLTNISIAYPNEMGAVAELLAPVVPVRKQSDKYREFGREALQLEPGSDVRAPGTEANEIPGLTVSVRPYFAIEHALQIAVTDEERENADAPLSPERDGVELLTSKFWLSREVALKTKFMDTNNYPASHVETLSGTDQFSAYATSDPIGVFKDARKTIHDAIMVDPNLAVIPYEVMEVLEDHPDFIERIKYTQAGVLSEDIIARLLRVPRIVVPGMQYNSSRMGTTAAYSYLWGKDILLAYVPPRPGMRQLAYAYEFAWVFPNGQRQIVDRWREEKRASDVIRVRRRYSHEFIAVDGNGDSLAGFLIKAAVA